MKNSVHQQRQDWKFHRMAAFCLMLGSLFVLIFRGLHGDLPAGDAHAAMQFISGHSFYKGVHMGDVVGVMITVIGFVSFSSTLQNRNAKIIGWLSVAIIVLGAAVHIVEFSIDGHAGETLAHSWEHASFADQSVIEHSAGTIFIALHGPALVSISMVWALSVVLLAWAIRHDEYPGWLTWAGLIVGILTFVLCIAQYLIDDFIPGFLIFGILVFLLQFWNISLGITVLRRIRRS
ncbi:hypothetical protein SD70_11180 [Gordoniibacillus kamchatkensis]|uniref:DUF998 domain-containing protein n=1 Tax=Gordoniibacillus kamchatkensis TaxID=1590651 RepID=A0ABR5AIC2_9BACL|nr:hypothetical protein [Paenibacillus sp. VKM B-2647]KIL40799.1 hypothetical protein SD70_11180 [Paenibacillus sp. VKM B-2647]